MSGARLVLVSCCAPCSAGAIRQLVRGEIPGIDDFIVYFYNPNIFPADEYQKRLAEQIKYCETSGVKYFVDEYDHDAWRAHVRGLEAEPERGARCSACFAFRFRRAVRWAAANGYDAISSVLGVSRHKNQAQVDAAAMSVIVNATPRPDAVGSPPATGGGHVFSHASPLALTNRIGGGDSDATGTCFHSRRYTKNALAQSKVLKQKMTDAERLLWYYLRGRKDFSFRKQAPIGSYVVDFVCMSRKLVIELDGDRHGDAAHRAHDAQRDKFLNDMGYRVLRFWNDDVFNNMNMVLNTIYSSLISDTGPVADRRTLSGFVQGVECPPPMAGGDPTASGRGVAMVRYLPIRWNEELRMQINRESDFYRQRYCGCEFSIR